MGPARPSANSAISCIVDPATSLPIEFSGPGVAPRDSAVMARLAVYLRPLLRAAHVASRVRTARSSNIGAPDRAREQHQLNIASKPVVIPDPIARRSFINVVR